MGGARGRGRGGVGTHWVLPPAVSGTLATIMAFNPFVNNLSLFGLYMHMVRADFSRRRGIAVWFFS